MRRFSSISEMTGRIALKFGTWLVSDPKIFTKVKGRAQAARAHVHAPFHISEMACRIALKFGVWFRGPLAMRFTQYGISARAHEQLNTVHTFKHIYSLPLVDRLKGVLLVNCLSIISVESLSRGVCFANL